MFEFIRVASLDPNNREAMKEAYWMVMYIFLQKTQSIDISDSFVHMGKIRNMLKDVDVSQFNFTAGFMVKNKVTFAWLTLFL